MSSDFEELLKVFNDSRVRYLIVGGYAVMAYGEPRYTKDLDVWIEASEENAALVFEALRAFGAPLSGLAPSDFAREGFFYQAGVAPIRVDILMSVDGLTFSEAWPNRQLKKMGTVDAWVVGRHDLIRNKRTTGRHIDLHDAENLEKG